MAVSDFTTFAVKLPTGNQNADHSSRRKHPQAKVKGVCGEKNDVRVFILPVAAKVVKFQTANDILSQIRR